MGLDEESVKSQLTDLFDKTDSLNTDMATMKVLVDQHKDTIKAINKSNETIQDWVRDAHTVLYGNEKTGTVGVVKQSNKMWLLTQRAMIGGVVGLYFIKETGILDNILGK